MHYAEYDEVCRDAQPWNVVLCGWGVPLTAALVVMTPSDLPSTSYTQAISWVGLSGAAQCGELGWRLGWVAGWLFKHTLQCTLTSRPELSCKARTGISSNSLGCADRGEGRKMLRLPLPFPCASPNVGENNECTECCERFIAEGERTGGNNAFLCNSSSLCNAWPFAKGTLHTKLGRPLYLSM